MGKETEESGASLERAVQTYSIRSEIAEQSWGTIALRLLWFYVLGLWLGVAWLVLAWIACATVIGLPLGMWMIHQSPKIMTLKEQAEWEPVMIGDRMTAVAKRVKQESLVVRGIWFVAVGWWASILWLKIAFGAAATFLLLPVSFWMINRLPKVMTLEKG